MESVAERFDTATASRQKFRPAMVALQDEGRWSGLRLEQWEGQSQDLPETVLFQHCLAVNLDSSTLSEVCWSGHRPLAQQFNPGTLGVFPAGLPYKTRNKGYWRGLIVAITPAFVQSVVPRRTAGPIELAPRFGISDQFIWHAAQALARDIREGYPCGSGYGEAIVVALAAHLVRNYAVDPRLAENGCESTRASRKRVTEFIVDQLDQPLSLADLAAFVQMDVYSFAKWFKAAFGSAPHQYILAARINAAKELLLTSPESVMDIALRCGFGSHSHFATTFRRFVGVSPKTYRSGKSLGGRQRSVR